MRLGWIVFQGLACVFAASAQAGQAQSVPAAADPMPTGSWEVVCRGSCTMRHRDASVRIGGFAADLEVQSLGGVLVPVVVARGVPPQAAVLAATVSVGMRLDKGPWLDMPCAGLLVCAPSADDAPALGRLFPTARSVSLRIAVVAPGAPALPPLEHAFRAVGTKEALARLTAAGPVPTSEPATPGLDWMGMARKLMRAGG